MNELQTTIESKVVDNTNLEIKNYNLNLHTKSILKLMLQTKKNLYEIAFRLADIASHPEYLEKDGFTSVTDYAEKVLGYKKAMVYQMINTANKFLEVTKHGKTKIYSSIFATPNADYSISQLQELVSLRLEDAQELVKSGAVKMDMTTKAIRGIVKDFKNGVIDENGNKTSIAEDTNDDSAAETTNDTLEAETTNDDSAAESTIDTCKAIIAAMLKGANSLKNEIAIIKNAENLKRVNSIIEQLDALSK